MDKSSDKSTDALQARLGQWRFQVKKLASSIDNLQKEKAQVEKEKAQVEKVIKNLEDTIAGQKALSEGEIASVSDEKMVEREEESSHKTQETKKQPLGTVLVVDDAKVLRTSMRRVLESAGYAVEDADDGTTALELLQDKTVDLVIADINMKYIDGLEMVTEMRCDPKTADIPVLMCTISNRKKDVIRAARLGVKEFLIKPIKPQVVLRKVNEIIGGENAQSSAADETTASNVEAA